MELVRTENLQLSFGAIVVADNINFSLHEGERLAVIGANGAGKTTFINIITGYLRARSGRIFCWNRCHQDVAPQHRASGPRTFLSASSTLSRAYGAPVP